MSYRLHVQQVRSVRERSPGDFKVQKHRPASCVGVCSRNKDGLLGQLLEFRSGLPVVMLEKLLELFSIESYTIEARMLLRKSLMDVEVIAHYLDSPLDGALRCHGVTAFQSDSAAELCGLAVPVTPLSAKFSAVELCNRSMKLRFDDVTVTCEVTGQNQLHHCSHSTFAMSNHARAASSQSRKFANDRACLMADEDNESVLPEPCVACRQWNRSAGQGATQS